MMEKSLETGVRVVNGAEKGGVGKMCAIDRKRRRERVNEAV